MSGSILRAAMGSFRGRRDRAPFLPALILLGLFFGFSAACANDSFAARQTDTVRHIVVLYTNDEHGWMEPYQNAGGSAAMAYKWREREGLTEGGPFLVLSGGDMWTGHALSTVWAGESMTDVMNHMGYDAAAIGNHDFDFGIDAIVERAAQAKFPLLSANIVESETGLTPDFADPYALVEVNGVKVGLIGLTTTETKLDTHPAHVAEFEFHKYADVLPAVVTQLRSEGAELLLIIGHVCAGETRALAPYAAEFGIHFIGGGHCHQEINEVVGDVQLVESGFFNRGYTRIDFLVDTETKGIVDLKTKFVRNDVGRQDAEIARLMDDWRARTDDALWEVIGYANPGIDRNSPEMASLLLDPWLDAWPTAEVALASPRYVQQDLFAGEISPGVLMGLLSTTNRLVEVDITGDQLIRTIEEHRPLMAGIVEVEGSYRLMDGTPVDPAATYQALVPEALYAGGNYYKFYEFDPDPTFTGIDWRQPPLDWIRSMGSSADEPINSFISDQLR